ncbi:FG-GAP repeat domain-containing protein [Clostridiisalibacter paucivorans]|uniref:FG-GAP repeat domain-containing protein n=1 Tax=Clostridiisalibacter paucivorans TaxID=408753 RepID=UPI00047C77FB|nr:VCBS repeat-containing protein [Clostridiisalibacter paucivorans]
MKRKIFLFIIAFVMIFSSGCEYQAIKSPMELIKKPKLDSNKDRMKKVVTSYLERNEKLIVPIKSSGLGAINIMDIDNDGIDEIISFFKNEQEYKVGVLILKDNKDKWKKTYIEGVGRDIAYAQIADITGDGFLELIVSWMGSYELEKEISIYDFKDDEQYMLFNNNYSEIVIDDFDGDNIMELFTLNLDRNIQQPKANGQLYKYEKGIFNLTDSIDIDPYINGYYNVISGKASIDKKGVFVDVGLGAHSAATILLIVEDDRIYDVFDSKSNYNETFKPYGVESKDIDGDGIIEIGNLQAPSGYESASMAGTPWITNWFKWMGDKELELVREEYYNYQDGYKFIFPEEWNDKITLEKSSGDESNWLKLKYIDKKTKRVIPIYKISLWDREEWQDHEVSEDVVIIEDNIKTYVIEEVWKKGYVPSRVKKVLLSSYEIEESFVLIKK